MPSEGFFFPNLLITKYIGYPVVLLKVKTADCWIRSAWEERHLAVTCVAVNIKMLNYSTLKYKFKANKMANLYKKATLEM